MYVDQTASVDATELQGPVQEEEPHVEEPAQDFGILPLDHCIDDEEHLAPRRPYVDPVDGAEEGMINYLERVAAIVRHNRLFTQLFLATHEVLMDEVSFSEVCHAPPTSEYPKFSWTTHVDLLGSLQHLPRML